MDAVKVLVNVTSGATAYEPEPEEPRPEPRWTLLYVSGWLKEENEAVGGRVLGTYSRLMQAWAEWEEFRRGRSALRLMYGEGWLVLVRRSGVPLFAEEGMPIVCDQPTVEEEAEVMVVR